MVLGHPVNGARGQVWTQGGRQRRRARATRGAATARGRGGPLPSNGLAGRSALEESVQLAAQRFAQNALFTRGGGVQGARAGRRARGCGPHSRGPWERPRRRGPTPRSFGRSPAGGRSGGVEEPAGVGSAGGPDPRDEIRNRNPAATPLLSARRRGGPAHSSARRRGMSGAGSRRVGRRGRREGMGGAARGVWRARAVQVTFCPAAGHRAAADG